MLAESSAFAIMMHQGDHWIYANRAAEEISGYTEAELCGSTSGILCIRITRT